MDGLWWLLGLFSCSSVVVVVVVFVVVVVVDHVDVGWLLLVVVGCFG